MKNKWSTLVDLCRQRSLEKPEARAYTYLIDGEEEEVRMSYGGLNRWAATIASELNKMGPKGERVLLLFPPGLEYIQAFFACLYAGMIAVPAYPPDPNRLERTLPRLIAILKDCGAKIILTTEMIQSMAGFLTAQAPELNELQWLATDSLALNSEVEFKGPPLQESDLAFLQYTSGSTGEPKGVMLTHHNLLSNLDLIQQHFGNVETSHDVSWLPPYHDMGLIGDILGTLYCGGSMTIINPLHFIQKPLRWLKTISRTRADISGGPNFAYQLCLRKVTEEDKKDLDLSCWEQAYCGAEPIAKKTMEAFARAFAPCGFRKEFLYPCYGMAEGTLLVSGNERTGGFRAKSVSKKTFQEKQRSAPNLEEKRGTLQWISCGHAMPGQEIRIVRPDTMEPCAEGEVGEIWLKGPSIAKGYWNKSEFTQRTFHARIPSTEEGPYLRSGDLGFLEEGQLYVTGRLKDLIIIRGTNHYPQDLEHLAEGSHPAVRPGCVAAFSVPDGWEEKLVLVLEVDPQRAHQENVSMEEIREALVGAIAKDFELEVEAIAAIKKGSLPKTSSGKLQRSATREAYLKNTLEVEYRWKRSAPPQEIDEGPLMTIPPARPREQDAEESGLSPIPENIRPWLIHKITRHLGMTPEKFDPARPFSDYGLASKDAVELSGDLGDWLGHRFSPTLLWKYPSVESLAEYLSQARDSQV